MCTHLRILAFWLACCKHAQLGWISEPPKTFLRLFVCLFFYIVVADLQMLVKTHLRIWVLLPWLRTHRLALPGWHAVVMLCCWCCAHRTGLSSANHVSWRREEAGEASVTANGPRNRSHSSSVELRHTVRDNGLVTGRFKHKNHYPKAQYNFHLALIHEILQAYLQVLRGLLLNLLLSTAELTAALCEIFHLLAELRGSNVKQLKKKTEIFFQEGEITNSEDQKRKKKEKKRQLEHWTVWLHLPVCLSEPAGCLLWPGI